MNDDLVQQITNPIFLKNVLMLLFYILFQIDFNSKTVSYLSQVDQMLEVILLHIIHQTKYQKLTFPNNSKADVHSESDDDDDEIEEEEEEEEEKEEEEEEDEIILSEYGYPNTRNETSHNKNRSLSDDDIKIENHVASQNEFSNENGSVLGIFVFETPVELSDR